MKEIIKVTREEKTVYVAKDGQEFSTARDCLRHEIDLSRVSAEERRKKLPTFTFTPPFEHDQGNNWAYYYVQSEADIAAIIEAEMDIDAVSDSWWDTRPEFPCWVVLVSDEFGLGVMYKWWDVPEMMKNYLGEAAERMKITLEGAKA